MQDLIIQQHMNGLGLAELRQFLFQNLAVAPSNPVRGLHYISSADGIFRYFNGTSWIDCREGTVRSVAIGAPAAGITVSGGPITDSGTITLALADDLLALEGLGSTGFAVRTAANTWAQRTLLGTANQVIVSDGDGVSGPPRFSLPQNIDTNADVTFRSLSLGADPTNANHAVTKAWVESLIQGLKWKDPVLTATTANLTLSGTQTVAGKAVVEGDRVGVLGQTNAADNGIYICHAGAWTRSADADLFNEIAGCAFLVLDGTNKGARYNCTSAKDGTLGVTALTFVQVDGGVTLGAGLGLVLNGNQLDVAVDDASLEIVSDVVRVKAGGITESMIAAALKDPAAGTAGLRSLGTGALQAAAGNHHHDTVYAKKGVSSTIGNGVLKTFTIAHPFASLDVQVSVRLTASPYTQVWCDARASDANNVIVEVLKAPANNEYTVTVRP